MAPRKGAKLKQQRYSPRRSARIQARSSPSKEGKDLIVIFNYFHPRNKTLLKLNVCLAFFFLTRFV